jgi:hypothetical protein
LRVGFTNKASAGTISAVDGTGECDKQKDFVGIGVDESGNGAMRLFTERVSQFAGRGSAVVERFNGAAQRMIRPERIEQVPVVRSGITNLKFARHKIGKIFKLQARFHSNYDARRI